MRTVADTNVYISALNFGGTAEGVLALARAGAIQLFVSPPILKEIEGVLTRKFRWSATRARQAVAAIQEFAELVRPREPVHLITEDEPDNRILECALAVNAEVLVTGDQHLRKLKSFRAVAIMSPAEFLETYGGQGQSG